MNMIGIQGYKIKIKCMYCFPNLKPDFILPCDNLVNSPNTNSLSDFRKIRVINNLARPGSE